ncbi:hypothetical protein AB0J72_33705 [Dactylosporangium sp. NPDC049742]|uniref:hypothetical protein n=1 Tax=Dactylosporangium sp. NPDC049742 TaxID=3154737 RepID=UPI003430C117
MSDHAAGFSVDLEAVRSFGTGLRADLSGHLSPEHDQILRTFVDTPTFGTRTASPDVQAAATLYHRKLIELLDLMDAFIHNGAVFVQAAEEVAAAYSHADTLSGDQFKTALAVASAKVDDALWAAQHDPRTGRSL